MTNSKLHSMSYSSVHCLNQVVDEVLSVAMVAALNVVQPLLVHATLKQQARSVYYKWLLQLTIHKHSLILSNTIPSKANSKQYIQL